MPGTAGSLQHPPGEEGNNLLVRGRVLGMPELHITAEIMNSRTSTLKIMEYYKYSEGKSLPLVGKAFSAMKLNAEPFPSSKCKDCNSDGPRIRSHGLHIMLTLQYIVN